MSIWVETLKHFYWLFWATGQDFQFQPEGQYYQNSRGVLQMEIFRSQSPNFKMLWLPLLSLPSSGSTAPQPTSRIDSPSPIQICLDLSSPEKCLKPVLPLGSFTAVYTPETLLTVFILWLHSLGSRRLCLASISFFIQLYFKTLPMLDTFNFFTFNTFIHGCPVTWSHESLSKGLKNLFRYKIGTNTHWYRTD